MGSRWVMQLGRIREVVSQIVSDFPWSAVRTHTKAREQELEQLAYAVLEFGKMQYQLYRNEITVVEVEELAFRFRETKHAITRTLELLEQHGLAERTDLPLLWKLHVADLDQQSRGGGFVRLIRGHAQ